MRVQIHSLREKAKQKPKGYFKDVMRHCRPISDSECELSDEDFLRLAQKYPARVPVRGLGDIVAIFARPIARLLDRLFKTKFEACKPCGQRQEEWNKALPL